MPKRKRNLASPFLISSLESENSLLDYVESNGGFTSSWEPPSPEPKKEPKAACALPPPEKENDNVLGVHLPVTSVEASSILSSPCTSKSKSRQTKKGSLPLAEAILDAVEVRNIGGTLWVRKDPPLYRPMTVEDVGEILRDLGNVSLSDTRVMQSSQDVYDYLRTFSSIKLPELPVPKGRILFDNNVWFDCTKNKPVAPSVDDIITHQINAKLYSSRIPTPHWNSFLESVSDGDRSIQDLILAMIGYLMLPEQDGKVFFVLGTAPDSGKSVLGHLLQRLFGEDNTSAVSLHNLKGDFALSPLRGKKLNVAMDLPSKPLTDTAVGSIKTMTGDDLVSINVKYQPIVQERIMTKFVFGTNSPLLLNNPDPAFYNRMVYIPFNNSIPKKQQKKQLLDLLWEERNGIVRQGVLAARKLIANNYQFPVCEQALTTVKRWSACDDCHVLDFVREWCVCGDPTVYSSTSGLHLAYRYYCRDHNYDCVGVSKFSRILNAHASSLQIRKQHRQDSWGFNGIILTHDQIRNNSHGF